MPKYSSMCHSLYCPSFLFFKSKHHVEESFTALHFSIYSIIRQWYHPTRNSFCRTSSDARIAVSTINSVWKEYALYCIVDGCSTVHALRILSDLKPKTQRNHALLEFIQVYIYIPKAPECPALYIFDLLLCVHLPFVDASHSSWHSW